MCYGLTIEKKEKVNKIPNEVEFQINTTTFNGKEATEIKHVFVIQETKFNTVIKADNTKIHVDVANHDNLYDVVIITLSQFFDKDDNQIGYGADAYDSCGQALNAECGSLVDRYINNGIITYNGSRYEKQLTKLFSTKYLDKLI